jgi:hypothetical protein
MRTFIALVVLCAALGGCGRVYTDVQRLVRGQFACVYGLLLEPEESCWSSVFTGEAEWQANWP